MCISEFSHARQHPFTDTSFSCIYCYDFKGHSIHVIQNLTYSMSLVLLSYVVISFIQVTCSSLDCIYMEYIESVF